MLIFFYSITEEKSSFFISPSGEYKLLSKDSFRGLRNNYF